jgi:hypothetical protein
VCIMSTLPPTPIPEDNQILGYCGLWNGYFIGTSAASVVLIGLILYLSYRRDKAHSPGVIDFGLPWGIGCFLFHIGLWNMAPPNIFFVLFYEGLPGLFPYNTRAACIQVENIPIITTFFILLGLQIVFLYSHDSLAECVRPELCNDDDLLPKGAAVEEGDNAKVLLVGMPNRGRLLVERLEARRNWKSKQSAEHFVARTIAAFYPYVGFMKQLAHIRNNINTKGLSEDDYEIVVGQRSTRENVYILPLKDNEVDKVIMSPFIRNGPPLGSFSSSESSKAARMALLLDEVIRVLKPGGKIVCVDGAGNILVQYADLRDKLGEKNVSITLEKTRKLEISIFFKMPLATARATKPLDWTPPVKSPKSPKSPRSPSNARRLEAGYGDDQPLVLSHQILNEDELIGIDDEGSEMDLDAKKEKLSEPVVLGTMMPIQALIFFALCFLGTGTFQYLNVPDMIPIGERVGNLLPNVALSYPSMAFFEREFVLVSSHFVSVPQLLKHMLKTSTVALLATIFFTALYSLPKLGFQVALAQSSLNSTVRGLIGIATSLLLGFVAYKLGRYRTNIGLLKSRNLDKETYWKFLQ